MFLTRRDERTDESFCTNTGWMQCKKAWLPGFACCSSFHISYWLGLVLQLETPGDILSLYWISAWCQPSIGSRMGSAGDEGGQRRGPGSHHFWPHRQYVHSFTDLSDRLCPGVAIYQFLLVPLKDRDAISTPAFWRINIAVLISMSCACSLL